MENLKLSSELNKTEKKELYFIYENTKIMLQNSDLVRIIHISIQNKFK